MYLVFFPSSSYWPAYVQVTAVSACVRGGVLGQGDGQDVYGCDKIGRVLCFGTAS